MPELLVSGRSLHGHHVVRDMEMMAMEGSRMRERTVPLASQASRDEPAAMTYPEGGTAAWLVVVGAFCAMIPPVGLVNTMSVLQAWVSENELAGESNSKIGWIFSIYGFLITGLSAQVGAIFDAHEIRLLFWPGSVGMVLSLVFLSLSTQYYQFLLSFGVLGGVSASLLFSPAVSCIGHWFCKRRGLATGLAYSAGGLGGVAFSFILLYLAPRIGFPWTIRVMALVSLVLLVAANILVRKRLPHNKAAGLMIDFRLLRRTKFAATVLAIFSLEFAYFVPGSYIASYAVYYGISRHHAYLLCVYVNAGAIPGRILPAYIADRFGVYNMVCLTTLACLAVIMGLWFTALGDEARTIAFAVLFGFWSGAAISLSPVCVSRVCKIEDYGKCNGLAYFVASFGALAGIPIAGALLDSSREPFQALVLFGAGLYAAAFVAFCVARGISGGWKPSFY